MKGGAPNIAGTNAKTEQNRTIPWDAREMVTVNGTQLVYRLDPINGMEVMMPGWNHNGRSLAVPVRSLRDSGFSITLPSITRK